MRDVITILLLSSIKEFKEVLSFALILNVKFPEAFVVKLYKDQSKTLMIISPFIDASLTTFFSKSC